MFQLPKFALTDERGRPFGSGDLAGRVWVASFIFTSCPSICPKLMAELAKIQAELRAADLPVRIVSFSVDPVSDTPEKLAAYGRRFGADPSRWTFLTGPLGQVEDAVKRGFRLAMERTVTRVKDERGERDLFDIVHGSRFVLVDGGGGIRGYYEADDQGRGRLLAAARSLVALGE
jgi:protein SCO1/2